MQHHIKPLFNLIIASGSVLVALRVFQSAYGICIVIYHLARTINEAIDMVYVQST